MQMEDLIRIHKNIQVQKTDAANVVIPHIHRNLDVLQADSNVYIATNMGISGSYAITKNESGYKKNTRKPRAHQLMIRRAAVCGQSDASFSSS